MFYGKTEINTEISEAQPRLAKRAFKGAKKKLKKVVDIGESICYDFAPLPSAVTHSLIPG
jgi:hypothetical protein